MSCSSSYTVGVRQQKPWDQALCGRNDGKNANLPKTYLWLGDGEYQHYITKIVGKDRSHQDIGAVSFHFV